jgi:hypothetical protein
MVLVFRASREHKGNIGSTACSVNALSFCSLEWPDRMDAIYAGTMSAQEDEWL